MREYEVTIKVKVKEYWADIKDFEKEIEQFNESNKGVIEAEIGEVKKISEGPRPHRCRLEDIDWLDKIAPTFLESKSGKGLCEREGKCRICGRKVKNIYLQKGYIDVKTGKEITL